MQFHDMDTEAVAFSRVQRTSDAGAKRKERGVVPESGGERRVVGRQGPVVCLPQVQAAEGGKAGQAPEKCCIAAGNNQRKVQTVHDFKRCLRRCLDTRTLRQRGHRHGIAGD